MKAIRQSLLYHRDQLADVIGIPFVFPATDGVRLEVAPGAQIAGGRRFGIESERRVVNGKDLAPVGRLRCSWAFWGW